MALNFPGPLFWTKSKICLGYVGSMMLSYDLVTINVFGIVIWPLKAILKSINTFLFLNITVNCLPEMLALILDQGPIYFMLM